MTEAVVLVGGEARMRICRMLDSSHLACYMSGPDGVLGGCSLRGSPEQAHAGARMVIEAFQVLALLEKAIYLWMEF